jgi:hypothetical protein
VCPIFVARARIVRVRLANALLRSRLGARPSQNVEIVHRDVAVHHSSLKAMIPGEIMAILDISLLKSSTDDIVGKSDTDLPA